MKCIVKENEWHNSLRNIDSFVIMESILYNKNKY